MQSRERDRSLSATAPRLQRPSTAAPAKTPLLVVVSGAAPGIAQCRSFRAIGASIASPRSLLLYGKGKKTPRDSGETLGSQPRPWHTGPERCLEARAAFPIFLFAKLLILQHLEIPQMSVNLKYRSLLNAWKRCCLALQADSTGSE